MTWIFLGLFLLAFGWIIKVQCLCHKEENAFHPICIVLNSILGSVSGIDPTEIGGESISLEVFKRCVHVVMVYWWTCQCWVKG